MIGIDMIFLLLLTACGIITDKNSDDTSRRDLLENERDSGVSDSGTNGPNGGPNGNGTGDGTGNGTQAPEYESSINGLIDIQLFIEGEDGERDMISWEDAYAGLYPFGKIFVTAYDEDVETGTIRYLGYDVIENPQPTGNPYSIEIEATGNENMRVYAVLDYYVDNITGTDEPIGGYTRALNFEVDGTNFQINDINFSILSPLYEPRPPCDNNRTISIDGDVTLTETYIGGDVAVMLMKPGNLGPVHYTIVTPTEAGGGASGTYTIDVCENYGYMLLKGCWDENRNGMFDPMDEFGPYISQPNQSGNPITVGYTNLSNYEIQIPLNNSSGLALVPFVYLSGSVQAGQSTFDAMAPGSTLYIAALKYRPDGDISVSTLEEQSYDYEKIEWSALTGKTSIDWRLIVPAETITYLWAYLDKDNNGILNEHMEPIASGGIDQNGKFPTGNYSSDNIDMVLLSFTE